MSKTIFGLSLLGLVVLMMVGLRVMGGVEVTTLPDIDPSPLARLAHKDCQRQWVHFFYDDCPACERADVVLRGLSVTAQKCLVGVSLTDYNAETKKHYHAIVQDRGGGARIDWGVRKAPTTFWVEKGRIVRVKRNPVTIEDLSWLS